MCKQQRQCQGRTNNTHTQLPNKPPRIKQIHNNFAQPDYRAEHRAVYSLNSKRTQHQQEASSIQQERQQRKHQQHIPVQAKPRNKHMHKPTTHHQLRRDRLNKPISKQLPSSQRPAPTSKDNNNTHPIQRRDQHQLHQRTVRTHHGHRQLQGSQRAQTNRKVHHTIKDQLRHRAIKHLLRTIQGISRQATHQQRHLTQARNH